jgi:hypothetical protein
MVTRLLFTNRHAATFNKTSIFKVRTKKIHEIRRWICQISVRDDYSFLEQGREWGEEGGIFTELAL